MTALAAWAGSAVLGSGVLMLVVLAARGPVRRWIGPGIGYALWALPAVRLVLPPLPADWLGALPSAATFGGRVLAVGPLGLRGGDALSAGVPVETVLLVVWLVGAVALLGSHIGRYARFRCRVLASATALGARGTIRIVAAAIDGPLAFGVVHRYVAVPRDFADRYTAREQDLALAHECAHHARGDLVANWVSLAVLAVHWWNPLAWVAIGAFREDQEFAVDAHVLMRCAADARPAYAHVLAKAAGLGALPVANLNPRSNLKGRLMMLAQPPLPRSRSIVGGSALALLAAAALAATVPVAAAPAGQQAVTIGIKPDGNGAFALIVGGASVAPGTRLPGGAMLPSDLSPNGGCDLTPSATPRAMVLKGSGGITTYTVMCASAAPASVKATLGEGAASLKTMRASVASQPASPQFPEAERTHALGAIDRSIAEVEAALATAN